MARPKTHKLPKGLISTDEAIKLLNCSLPSLYGWVKKGLIHGPRKPDGYRAGWLKSDLMRFIKERKTEKKKKPPARKLKNKKTKTRRRGKAKNGLKAIPEKGRLIGTKDAAKYLGCSEANLYLLSRTGKISRPVKKPGYKIGWNRAELKKLHAKQKAKKAKSKTRKKTKPKTKTKRKTLGVAEAAKLIGVSVATIHIWVKNGKLPSTKPAPGKKRRTLRWRRSTIEALKSPAQKRAMSTDERAQTLMPKITAKAIEDDNGNRFIKSKDLARILGCGTRDLYEAAKRGKIPASITAKRKNKTLGGWRLDDAGAILGSEFPAN